MPMPSIPEHPDKICTLKSGVPITILAGFAKSVRDEETENALGEIECQVNRRQPQPAKKVCRGKGRHHG